MEEAVAAMKPREQEDLASASTLPSTFITKSFRPGWVHHSEERKGINPKDMSLERLSSGEILELGTEKARMELMRRLTSQWPEPQ